MKSLTIIMLILPVSMAQAWRETNDGGGITEQNIVYLQLNNEQIMNSLRFENFEIQKFSEALTNAKVKFENQETVDKLPFQIKEDEWWIQTKYLGEYDLDLNDELSWSEAAALLFDMYSQASSLNQFVKTELKEKLNFYFKSKIVQQVVRLAKEKKLQTTAFLSANNIQSDFLVQIEYSNPVSLTHYAPQFTGCRNLEKVHFQNIRTKQSEVIDMQIKVLAATRMFYQCEGRKFQSDLIVRFQVNTTKMEIVDWGIQ